MDVVTILHVCSRTHNLLLAIPIILGAHLPLAVELHSDGAGHVVDHLFLLVAVGGLHIAALVVILKVESYTLSLPVKHLWTW